MIKPEDISLSYTGSPNTKLGLDASLLYSVRFDLSDDDRENQQSLQMAMFAIMDKVYDEVKADLVDILEEYQMRHRVSIIENDPVADMIHSLLHKVSYHPK